MKARLGKRPVRLAPGRGTAGASAPERAPSAFQALLTLQATAGNAAVQRLLEVQRQDEEAAERVVPARALAGRGEPAEVEVEGGCDGLSLHGRTNARFNGGRWSVAGQRVTTSTACDCPPGARCVHLTGTLVAHYAARVRISMPGVPPGLTHCEAATVRRFLRDELLPHERDHERRFRTYDGTTRTPLDLTGCGMPDVQSQIAALQAAEDGQRQASANALSGAIDPFVRVVDCADCDG